MEENIDSKYEFNAPKYIDFLQGDVDEDADRWFDERDGDEGGIDIDMVEYYEEAMQANGGFQSATSAITAALQENQEPVNSENKPATTTEQTTEHQDVSMMDTDMPEENTTHPEKADIPQQQQTESEMAVQEPKPEVRTEPIIMHEVIEQKVDQVNEQQPSASDNPSSLQSVKPAAKPVIKPRKSNIRTSWNSPHVGSDGEFAKRSLARRSCNNKPINYSETKKRKKTLSEDVQVLPKKHKPEVKLTTSETPQFVRKLRERGIKRGPSSEAIQLKQIRQLQKQTRENVKKNEKRMNKAIKAGPYVPLKCSEEVTHPVAFSFESDKRVKSNHGTHTRSNSESKTFQNQLRKHPPSPTFIKKAPTKPKPFHFTLPDKEAPKQKWESMAQFAMNYQTKTPERFRAKPKAQEGNKSMDGDKKHAKPQLTQAKTPMLMTKKRSRPVTQESTQQIEEKTVDEMKKYKFKANDFDRRIVEKQGMFGVKKIPEVKKTSVKPFSFEIEKRIENRKQKEEPDVPPTCKPTKTNTSLNGGGKPDQPRPRKTEVKPFSFENRDKQRYTKKEEKIKEFITQEEKMHEFHARPLPSFSPDQLPAVRTKESTLPEPFHISSGSMAYKQKFTQQAQEKEQDEKTKREFKASESVTTKREPFKPLQGLIPPTNVKNVQLNSDIRAKERAKFDEWKSEQERAMEEEKLRFQKEKELQEMEAIKQLRKDAIPKANPVPHFKNFDIHKSEKPLTEPHTPHFECKKRALSRM